MEKICVIGLGYIGLPTASLLATKGFRVVGVDVDSNVVETINNGLIHIYEPDLDILVRSAVQSRNLTASLIPENADIFIIAVPTPARLDKSPDVSYVDRALESLAPYVQRGNLIILESTCPIGMTEGIAVSLTRLRPDLPPQSISIAHCPERVLPGHILKELIENDRIVGGVNKASTEHAKRFYASFVRGDIFETDSRTAELAKLSENAFRDVNIAFANELSLICDKLKVDVWDMIRLANRHPRVKILSPGPGVGGHCIAVDPWFIVASAPEEARLIRCAREVNDQKPLHVADQVLSALRSPNTKKLACFGLTFKPNVDDLRESPAIEVVQVVSEKFNGTIHIVEPHVKQLPQNFHNNSKIELVDIEIALKDSDVVLFLVAHKAFLEIKPDALQGKTVFDSCGLFR